MAEALALVASGISVAQLASQVINSVLKLKVYWDQIREAPDEIQGLLSELELLTPIILYIQNDQVVPDIVFDNTSLAQTLKSCKDRVEEPEALVRELGEKLEVKSKWKKTIVSAKVVLRKHQIEKLERKMKSDIELLKFAC
jgi:hypothetical protein